MSRVRWRRSTRGQKITSRSHSARRSCSRACARHSERRGRRKSKTGDLVVDLTARVVTRGGHEVKLTATEYALLRLFVRHPGRVLTHRHILREIWGPKSEEHRQYLRVYMTHLRQKIEADPARIAAPAPTETSSAGKAQQSNVPNELETVSVCKTPFRQLHYFDRLILTTE